VPSALRVCPHPGCPELTRGGPCPEHARDSRVGSAWRRGYDAAWQQLRDRVRRRLIALGISPICGARLPGAELTTHSRCAAEGRDVPGTHYDHIEPFVGLDDPRRLDPLNLQLLCASCHSRKTDVEDGGFGNA
jgi:5-methylcytosine-specific restriction protein A